MHGSSSGIVVNPRRANFVAARQGAHGKIMESNRKDRKESSFYLHRDNVHHWLGPLTRRMGRTITGDSGELDRRGKKWLPPCGGVPFLANSAAGVPRGGVDSRAGRRPTLRLPRVHREAPQSVHAVNAEEGEQETWRPVKMAQGPTKAAQLRALKDIQTMHTSRKWPESGTLQTRAALRKLLRTSVACGSTAGTLL